MQLVVVVDVAQGEVVIAAAVVVVAEYDQKRRQVQV